MKLGFKMHGAGELSAMLQIMPAAVANRVGRAVVISGARVIGRAIKKNTPVDEDGNLKRAVKAKMTRKRAGKMITAQAGVFGREGALAHLLEFGTEPHLIKAKNAKKLRYVKGGEVRYRSSVMHPGSKDDAFVRPAADANTRNAVQKMAEMMKKRVEAEANRLAAKPSDKGRRPGPTWSKEDYIREKIAAYNARRNTITEDDTDSGDIPL